MTMGYKKPHGSVMTGELKLPASRIALYLLVNAVIVGLVFWMVFS